MARCMCHCQFASEVQSYPRFYAPDGLHVACIDSCYPDASISARPAGPPPPVDTSIHSVPVEDGEFVRFNQGSARLSEASETQTTSLRDRIRPVYQPNYEGPKVGVYLFPDELIIGIESATEDYAYPMQRH